MKKLILTIIAMAVVFAGHSQIDIGGKIKNKLNDRANQKTDEAIDKGLNEAENDAKKSTKKKDKNSKDGAQTTTTEEQTQGTPTSSAAGEKPNGDNRDLKSYSKFDFIPGDKVTFYDDFTQAAIGDFPANWNTSGTGEVVTIGSNTTERWLKWGAGVSYAPTLTTPFPDNFTMEFDLFLNKGENSTGAERNDPYFGLTIYSSGKDEFDGSEGGKAGVNLTTQGAWQIQNWSEGEDVRAIGESKQITNSTLYGKKTHISVWGQKQRLRIYVNETKVLDLPQAIPAGFVYNRIKFINNPGLNLSNDDAGEIYLANIRVAIGAPDMRSKLITDGKLVTRGITFNSGSDLIKAESYGTLKEIAQVLKDNAAVKVKIIGHTDSDGADAANLELSKKRAAAIKNSLIKDFGIDESRLVTDGKGEAEPVSPNTSAEGKANNRRVEFIKL